MLEREVREPTPRVGEDNQLPVDREEAAGEGVEAAALCVVGVSDSWSNSADCNVIAVGGDDGAC